MEPFEKYYTLAVVYLTRRPRSEKELREYLQKKSTRFTTESEYVLTLHLLDEVIAKLQSQKFQSDYDFAIWWKQQRNRFRLKGDSVIKMELKQKGIDRDIIEQVFQVQDEEDISDQEKVRQIVEKRFEKVRLLSKHEQYEKLGSYLARRGFSWDTIKRAIDDIRTKSYNKP